MAWPRYFFLSSSVFYRRYSSRSHSHRHLHAREELSILGHSHDDHASSNHEFSNAALITYEAYDRDPSLFPHYGVLGSVLRQTTKNGGSLIPTDPRLYFNTSTPWSAVVSGVQGSGKSHTVSCLLEASLVSDQRIGSQTEPLAGLVFHYDEENGGRPCEAAYLSAPSNATPMSTAYVRKVTVLVSPKNLRKMREVYASLPNVDVQPLYFKEVHLNAARMLAMMGCDDIDALPLYMKRALSIVRELGADDFSYNAFKAKLKEAGSTFNGDQRAGVGIRMGLLDSYLDEFVPDVTTFFKKGDLVIVDLSDPFLAAIDAALLFDIALGLFVDWKTPAGKIVVLDEAHKYLTNSATARLSRSLSSLIRQQRHLGIRLIIATQEPTVVPITLVELCSFVICHKFSSPGWVSYLKGHISIGEGSLEKSWEEEVMQLRTGQALVFCSGALCLRITDADEGTGIPEKRELVPLGMGSLLIRTRLRITLDGGRSIVAGRVSPSPGRVSDGSYQSAPISHPRPPMPRPTTLVSDFAPLVRVLAAQPQSKVGRSFVNDLLTKEQPNYLAKAGFPRWSLYAQAAQEAGVVELGVTGSTAWVSLKIQPTPAQAKKTVSTPASTAAPVDKRFLPLLEALAPHGTARVLQTVIAEGLKAKAPRYLAEAGFK